MWSNRLDRLPALVQPGGLVIFEAATRRSRLIGLSLIDGLRPDQALLILRCRSVHTFWMRFPIDITFLGKSGEVVRLVAAARPRRLFGAAGARAVLETAAGQAERFLEALPPPWTRADRSRGGHKR